MCGIVSLYLKNKPVNLIGLKRSLMKLEHRGPDEKNYWVSENNKVALGHARLSIIGLNNGKQPLSSATHGIYAVVNGEFYDYKNIRKKYQRQGYEFSTETDSEIIIPLYLEYGTQLFEKLNGEFAFVIWDVKNKQILAARDRFGIKPLFYSYNEGNLYIASEVKALLPLGIKAEWDHYALECIFKGVPSQNLSCFKGINQIKPGHFLRVSNDTFEERKYWDFAPSNSIKSSNEQEYIACFREKLTLAIKKRLIADVPVGFYLSGGIDSSALLALASQYTNNLRAFNISFQDTNIDEGAFAKSIAAHVGVDFSSIIVTQQDLADNFSNVIYHRESLVFQANGVAKYLLSKHAHDAGFKVVLTGEGADEILGGYPPIKEDLAYYLHAQGKRALLKKLKGSGSIALGTYDTQQLIDVKNTLGFLPSYWKLSFDIGNVIEKCYSDFFKENTFQYTPMQDFIRLNFLKDVKKDHPVSISSYIFSKTFFPEFVLSYLGDRVEMAHSIEGRVPFLDIDLVKFVQEIPIDLKIRNTKEKYILYEAVRDLVPQAIYQRNKHAIRAPSIKDSSKKVLSPMEELMSDTFHSRDFKDLYFLDQTRTLNLFNEMKKIDKSTKMLYESALYFILSAYFLHKHFFASTNLI